MLYDVASSSYKRFVAPAPTCMVCLATLDNVTQNYRTSCGHTFHHRCLLRKQSVVVRGGGADATLSCPICAAPPAPPPPPPPPPAPGIESLPQSDDRSLHDALARVQSATIVLYRQQAPKMGWDTDPQSEQLFTDQLLEITMLDDSFLRSLHLLARMERGAKLSLTTFDQAERDLLMRPAYQFLLLTLCARMLSASGGYEIWDPVFTDWGTTIIHAPGAREQIAQFGLLTPGCAGRFSALICGIAAKPAGA